MIVGDEWDTFFRGIHATCYYSSQRWMIYSLFFWSSSKEVEVPSCNGDIAFQEVRIQQSVVEFILNHTQQIFNQELQPSKSREGTSSIELL